MKVDDNTAARLHNKLPIDKEEVVLAIYRHHWFAYAVNWVVGGVIALVIMGLAVAVVAVNGDNSSIIQYKSDIFAGTGFFALLILLATIVPVYLRSQEQLVLTNEALLQVLRPTVFTSKIDQLNLQRIDDVSVHQDFFGTIFGFGHLTIETPGEQDNYEFRILPDCHDAAREITNARENYEAAMQAGRLPTTLGEPEAAPLTIDPKQYEQFLAFQRMQAQQKQSAERSDPAEEFQQGVDSAPDQQLPQPPLPPSEA